MPFFADNKLASFKRCKRGHCELVFSSVVKVYFPGTNGHQLSASQADTLHWLLGKVNSRDLDYSAFKYLNNSCSNIHTIFSFLIVWMNAFLKFHLRIFNFGTTNPGYHILVIYLESQPWVCPSMMTGELQS